MRKQLLYILLVISASAGAQTSFPETEANFKLGRTLFQSEHALKTVAFVEQRWRIAGNTGFNESIRYVEDQLKQAGFKEEGKEGADGLLTYRIEKRTMKKQTWEPVNASVKLGGDAEPLLQFSTNRNMIAINSSSTSGNLTADVVYVGAGRAADLAGKDLKGKILFGESNTGTLYSAAVKNGAAGVFVYNLPAYVKNEIHVNSIQFGTLPSSNDNLWAVILSYKAKERLKQALTNGPVTATVSINTKRYQAEELTLIADIKGSVKPDERFVFSAHVQEPGANDNASGVGTLAEMARVSAQLVKSGKLKPKRTLTFLWGDEIVSTERYIKDDAARAKGIRWGMSLDMVGEDTGKTGGSFLIEKMPDPSAIWTRGTDKHTEWGASDVKESDLFPHYFNDFVFDRCREQGTYAKWTVNYNPFEGGSDHTPFLQAKIPGILMWHFTDVFYHTDADRLAMVSGQTMKNVGVTALSVAYTLVNGGEKTALSILAEVLADGKKRLQTEFVLSKRAVADGKKRSDEQHILETWWKWYDRALATTTEIQTGGSSANVEKAIEKSKKDMELFYRSLTL